MKSCGSAAISRCRRHCCSGSGPTRCIACAGGDRRVWRLSRCEVDFRVGGAWAVTMKAASGYEHPVHGVFTEIEEPTRLCFTYINDYDGHEMLVEMDFAAEGTGTRMEFVQAPFLNVAERDGHRFRLEQHAQHARDLCASKWREAGGVPVGNPRQPGDL